MTGGGPLVTIGIPFYNEEKYIRMTIESALTQTYGNLRILIGDNCSTDASSNVARELAAGDSRVIYFRHERNIGPVANFEFLRDQADSEYFVWLGGHDVILPNYIADAVDVLTRDAGVVLAYPGGVNIDADGLQMEVINDNYDTQGLTVPQAICKIARHFYNGYVIHGVFRLAVLRRLPFEKVNSPDMLMIMFANLYGRIARIPAVGFQRRMIRKETPEQQKQRHTEQGVYKNTKLNPFNFLLVMLYRHVWKADGISIGQKLSVMRELKAIFTSRFKVKWRNIFKSVYYSTVQ